MIAGIIGISSSAIVTKVARRAAPPRQPGDPAHPRHHRDRGPLPRPLPGGPGPGARAGQGHRRGPACCSARLGRVPGRAGRCIARFGTAWVEPSSAHRRRRAAGRQLRRHRPAGGRDRRTGWPVGRHRGVPGRPGASPRPRWPAGSRKLVLPLRDTFAAIFFFAFGLSVDPGDAHHRRRPGAGLRRRLSLVLTMAGRHRSRPASTAGTALAAANIGLTTLARGEFALILGAAWRSAPASTSAWLRLRGALRAGAGRGQSRSWPPGRPRSPGSIPPAPAWPGPPARHPGKRLIARPSPRGCGPRAGPRRASRS